MLAAWPDLALSCYATTLTTVRCCPAHCSRIPVGSAGSQAELFGAVLLGPCAALVLIKLVAEADQGSWRPATWGSCRAWLGYLCRLLLGMPFGACRAGQPVGVGSAAHTIAEGCGYNQDVEHQP